jgi:hypothetical protein
MDTWQRDMEERKLKLRERRADLKELELQIRKEEVENKKDFQGQLNLFMREMMEKQLSGDLNRRSSFGAGTPTCRTCGLTLDECKCDPHG